MEKIVLDLSKLEPEVKLTFGEQIVKVKPYINMSDRQLILNAYFKNYSDDVIEGYITNHYGLMLAILDVLTNIDINNISIDALVDSGLWDKIAGNIKNLGMIDFDIDMIKKEIDHKESVESQLSKLLDGIQSFFEKISNVDLSQEGVKELLQKFDEVKSELGNYYPVVKDESEEQPDTKKPKEAKKTS